MRVKTKNKNKKGKSLHVAKIQSVTKNQLISRISRIKQTKPLRFNNYNVMNKTKQNKFNFNQINANQNNNSNLGGKVNFSLKKHASVQKQIFNKDNNSIQKSNESLKNLNH